MSSPDESLPVAPLPLAWLAPRTVYARRVALTQIQVTPRLLATLLVGTVVTFGALWLLAPVAWLRLEVRVGPRALEIRYSPLRWLSRTFPLGPDLVVKPRPPLADALSGINLEVYRDGKPVWTICGGLTEEQAAEVADAAQRAMAAPVEGL